MGSLKTIAFLAAALTVTGCQKEQAINYEPDGSFTLIEEKESFSYDSYTNLCVYASHFGEDIDYILIDRKCDGHVETAISKGEELSLKEIKTALRLDPYAILKNYYAEIGLEERINQNQKLYK